MPKVLALAGSILAALFMASGAYAQGFDFVAGFGSAPNGTAFAAAALSGPQGQNPFGAVVTRAPNGTFHGDVSAGCLLVTGNHAAAIGRLPLSEQFTTPGFGTVEYDAVFVEDNGRPQNGQPVDRVSETLLLKATSAAHFCGAGVFTWPPSLMFTLQSGDFVVHDALP